MRSERSEVATIGDAAAGLQCQGTLFADAAPMAERSGGPRQGIAEDPGSSCDRGYEPQQRDAAETRLAFAEVVPEIGRAHV